MANKVESSALSVISEEKASARKSQDNNDEFEFTYNQKSKSAYGGGHKKKLHPLMLGPSRHNQGKLVSLHSASKNNLSEFTQRIMSAKLLRVKQIQNQLTETQIQLNELINENRILKNMQKRQEGALKRYEGNHAELPQLIRSHNEEIRALKANNKVIKAQLRESNSKLKERENELEALRDNYNKLKKLSTEKNLLEREKLQKKVEDLQEIIKEQEEKIQVLSRKILLESKSYRHHLNIEIMKHKDTQKELNNALSLISKLENQLVAKDRILPGGRVQIKRDNKNIVPIITNKSLEIQPKIGSSEDSFLIRDDVHRKLLASNSPDSELELLNALGSSEDTPSPTQDIFPNIHKTKKSNPEIETTTEIKTSSFDIFSLHSGMTNRQLGKTRKTYLSKKNSRFSSDLEANARVIADKLNEDMEIIEELANKVTVNPSNFEKIDSLSEEMTMNTSHVDIEISEQSVNISDAKKLEEELDKTSKIFNSRKMVPKRKLEEENQISKISSESSELGIEEELSETQKEKFENISDPWSCMKTKIQEDRVKAEEKIKELKKINSIKCSSGSISSGSDGEQLMEIKNQSPEMTELKKNLRFAGITDDEYILQELQKTDKIFNKLKNETQMPTHKTSSSPSTEKNVKNNLMPKPKPKQQQNIKSFRTESHREPKYLEEFHSQYQKENLLKALKAIDIGKDKNLSSGDSGESESESKIDKFYRKNGLKHVKKLSSEKSNTDLMTELFGSKATIDKTENVKLEYGTVGGIDD